MKFKAPTLQVISDTHGDRSGLAAALQWGKKHAVAALAFLGDGITDLQETSARVAFRAPQFFVRGNGDSNHSIPHTRNIDFAGYRFFLCHGHLNGVQDDLGCLLAAASSAEADAALYGHTHCPFWEDFDGLLALNPGSLGRPRTTLGASFATIECPPGKWFLVRFWAVKKGTLGKYRIQEFTL